VTGLLFAVVVLAASPLQTLSGPVAPAARERAVEAACAESVTVEDLDGLLATGRLSSAIDAVRIAQCRADPALAGWLFVTSLLSHVEVLPRDPDLGYRAVRTLEAMPFDAIAPRLASADLGPIVDGEVRRLADDWLAPLLGGTSDDVPPPSPALRADLVAGLDRWREDLLGHGSAGIAAMDQDGERASQWVVDGLRSRYLETLAAEEGRLGVAAKEALDQLGLADERHRWPPEVHISGGSPPPDLPVAVATVDRVVVSSEGRVPGLRPLAAIALGLAIWLVAARARPAWRGRLFAGAAISLAPVAWLAAEALLALAGAPAPIDGRPSFNLGGAVGPGDLLREVEIEGEPYWEVEGGSARPALLGASPAADTLRIAVIGESSVFGADYLVEDCFATLLGVRLQSVLGRPVEVLNAGIGGVVSDEILKFTHEALETAPDLVVFYLGFNDLEPLASAADFRAWSPATMALRGISDRSRVVGALQRLGVRIGHTGPDPDGAFLDDRASTPAERRRVGRITAAMLTDNLTRMVRARGPVGNVHDLQSSRSRWTRHHPRMDRHGPLTRIREGRGAHRAPAGLMSMVAR